MSDFEQLAKTHAHPTLAETLLEAAEGVHGMVFMYKAIEK